MSRRVNGNETVGRGYGDEGREGGEEKGEGKGRSSDQINSLKSKVFWCSDLDKENIADLDSSKTRTSDVCILPEFQTAVELGVF